jgi:molecular chaperone DnaJ
VLVRVRPDERFLRDGADLVTALDVPAPLAALGATLEVPSLLDGSAPIEIAPGTQPGEVLLVRGQGMPALRRGRGGGARGNLRVVVNVVIPRHLDAEQRALVQQLADSIRPENLRGDESLLGKLKRLLG